MQQHSAVTLESIDPADRPFKELVSRFGKDVGLLIRQEIELAKAEIGETTGRVAKGAVHIGVGAFMAYAGLLALVSALVLVLITVGVASWLAAAFVAVALLAVGYGLVQSGRGKLASAKPSLQKTKANVKETVHRLKEQLQ